MAEQHGLPGAALGTAGLAFGAIGVVLAVTSWIAVGVMAVQENKHRAELHAQLGNLTDTKLELKTACALTELEMIERRYEDFSSMDDFECAATGDLEVTGEAAVLRDLHFKKSEKSVELVSCLRYRNKWSVHQVRADDDCDAAKEPQKKAKHE